MTDAMRRSLLSMPMLVVFALASSPALAHIGGYAGGFTNGLAHPFYGLDHVLAMVAVGLWASQLGRPALWVLPLTFPVVMALGASAGWSGMPFPWVEIGIAGTVIALGVAIAFALRPSLVVATALIALFALFHGYEHGASLPAHGRPLLHGLGFIAATLALHGIGLAIGVLTRRPLVMRVAGGAIAAAGLLLVVAH